MRTKSEISIENICFLGFTSDIQGVGVMEFRVYMSYYLGQYHSNQYWN